MITRWLKVLLGNWEGVAFVKGFGVQMKGVLEWFLLCAINHFLFVLSLFSMENKFHSSIGGDEHSLQPP